MQDIMEDKENKKKISNYQYNILKKQQKEHMLPKIRSKSEKIQQLQSILDKSRHKQWNDRFSLQSMPEYSPLKDPFIKKKRKSQTNKNPQFQLQTIGSPLHKRIVHRKSSLIQLSRYRQQEVYNKSPKIQNIIQNDLKQPNFLQKVQKILIKLQQILPQSTQDVIVFYKVLVSHAIPQFYIYYALKSYLRKSKSQINEQQFDIQSQMQKQIKQSKSRQSNYYKILMTHQTRQKFLEIFTKMIQQKIQNEQQILIYKEKLTQNIKTIRLMTLNLIEAVVKWRWHLNIQIPIQGNPNEQLIQQKWMFRQERAIFYVDKIGTKRKQNVLLKILNDNKFIFDSIIPNCIRMGTKNDPFLLSPLIKSQQKSEYLQIFQLPLQLINKYRKTMQYLAIQKAYEMKIQTIVQKKSIKRNLSDVQKVYLNNSPKQQKLRHSQNQHDGNEKLKISRVERLKKNQSRINMIKAVYDKSEGKAGKVQKQQNDMLELVKNQIQNKQNTKNRSELDEQFQNLVKQRFKLLNIQHVQHKGQNISNPKQIIKTQQHSQSKSIQKASTQQQKMINKVKNLNKQLKQKLQQLTKQTDTNAIKSPSSPYTGKSNKQIVQQLKKQIVQKIEIEQNQRLQLKKRKKQQEQIIIKQIKQKLKKQMQDRLEQKKHLKLIQKQQLQIQLKKQQDRIKEQKQLEIKLLMKISKQRQLRHIQKLKRQSIQKQNLLKQQLVNEQNLRKEQEQLVEKQKLEKQKIIKQLQIRQLKQQLQGEVRQMYTQKNIKQVQKSIQNNNISLQKLTKSLIQQKENQNNQDPPNYQTNTQSLNETPNIRKSAQTYPGQISPQKSEIPIQKLRLEKQIQLKKQLVLLKERQQRQINLLQKENELRQRMLKLKKNQQVIIDKDINGLMKSNIIIQRQKQLNNQINLPYRPNDAEQQKKQEILEKMRKEQEEQAKKQAQFEKIRKQRQIQEQIIRQKVRQRIEKQLRQQAVHRTKKQIEQREQKQYDRRKQQGEYRNKLFNQNPIDRQVIAGEEKNKILSSQFLSRQVREQNAKSSLRSKFQNELFASSLPLQFYVDKQYLKIKNTQHYLGDDYIYDKLQKGQQVVQRLKQIEHSPFKKSQIRQHIYELTDQQLYIYKKQKSKNLQNMVDSQKKDNNDLNSNSKYIYEEKKKDEGYQLMEIKEIVDEEKKFSVKVIKDRQEKYKDKKSSDSQEQQQTNYNKDNRNNIFNTLPTKTKIKKQAKQTKQKSKNKNKDEEQSNKDKKMQRNRKNSLKNTQTDEGAKRSSSISQIIKKKAVKPNKQLKNKNSQDDSQDQNEKLKKSNKKLKMSKAKLSNQLQSLQKNQSLLNTAQPAKISYKKQTEAYKSTTSRFSLQFQAIPESQLDHHLQNHYSRLALQQAQILTMDRFDLQKKLINQLTFSIILGSFENRMIGMAYVHHDRFSTNSNQTRKFVISHIGTYSNKDLKEFIIAICDFILLKDPCDQVEFCYYFNQNQEQQVNFSNQLTKWFNELGSIFQKKIDEKIYQRKFIYKRQYKHKCQIELNGINKSVFRNIVNINAGMLISGHALQQNKQYFRKIKNQDDQSNVDNRLIYLLMISELFRQYMTPQQAEILKKKLKQSQKCKQLLGTIITLQKKKLKLEQYKLSDYKNLIELNMKLMSHGKQTIKYAQDITGVINNEIFIAEFMFRSQLMFNFQVAALPVTEDAGQIDQRGRSLQRIKHVNYFRLNPFSSYKLHLVKSSLYNSQMYVFATDNPKLKVFIINAQQYLEIKTKQKRQTENTTYSLTLSNYIQIFMKNISKYDRDSQYKHIWIPQIATQRQVSPIKTYKQFYSRQIYIQQNISMSYKQFIPSGLIIQPEHRDLVIGVPFIIGVMSMNVQQVVEGTPLYGRIIDKNDVKVIEVQK